MPVPDISDTEALLESTGGHAAARGITRPLRTLVIAASVLALASLAVARWTSPQNLAAMDGLMKKDAESDSVTCSASGTNCAESKCCNEPGNTCFMKNEHWASCNATCSPKWKWTGNGWEEQDEIFWNCTALSEAPTDVSCTASGENCAVSKCCSDAGLTCFKKNDHWASCNQTCSPKMLWTGKGNNSDWEEQDEKIWDCDNMSLEKDAE